MQKETQKPQNNEFKEIIWEYTKWVFFFLIFPFALFFIYNDINYLKGALLGIILAIGLIYLNISKVNYIINNWQTFQRQRWKLRLVALLIFGLLFTIFYVVILFWGLSGFGTMAGFIIIQKGAYYYWFLKKRKVNK